jgi:putative ABC transport system substrate-binding protein
MVSIWRSAAWALKCVRIAHAGSSVVAILAVGITLVAAPACTPQSERIPRIGFLSSTPSTISEGLKAGLEVRGLVEGRNITVDWRWTEGKPERVAELAAELVRLKPDLIVTTSVQPTAAVKMATDTIPIVFIAAGDPVRTGLVASLARPGANVTGLSNLVSEEFSGKMIELLHAAVPRAAKVAVLLNPTNADHQRIMAADMPTAADRLRLTLLPIEAQTVDELDVAFERAARLRADAIVVLGDPLIYVNRARAAELAAKHRLPAMYFFRENVEAGGLMSYGPSLYDLGRRGATYVDKILKGARPADLPVEQAIKFDLVINLKAAKALGLMIPPALLQQAEQVIE